MNSKKAALLLALTIATLVVRAQEPGPAPQTEDPIPKEPGGFVFTLLPKSFASKPRIDMTVYSELTELGRTLPEASPENPAYYVAFNNGYQPMGSNPTGEHPPVADAIEALLKRVLAQRGFLASGAAGPPPTLALFYHWGSHSGVSLAESLAEPEMDRLRNQDVLQRAKLVGGPAYAEKLAREMSGDLIRADRTARENHLRYQIENDLYYVLVSAYEFTSLNQGQRRLVWRTTLTVNDQGVSMQETLPPLIASATAFFGRDTKESLALQRRINRGSVTLGPLIIIENDVPDPGAPESK